MAKVKRHRCNSCCSQHGLVVSSSSGRCLRAVSRGYFIFLPRLIRTARSGSGGIDAYFASYANFARPPVEVKDLMRAANWRAPRSLGMNRFPRRACKIPHTRAERKLNEDVGHARVMRAVFLSSTWIIPLILRFAYNGHPPTQLRQKERLN